MKHSSFLHPSAAVFLIILALVITGCRGEAEQPAIPSATISIPDPTSASQPTATFLPTETIVPTSTATPFVPKATIKIFSLSSLSRNLSTTGTDIMRGAELAVDQLAGPLMELGYKVELIPEDDQSDVMASVTASKEIAANPQVLCGVGPFTSRSINQVKEIFHQAKLGFVSPSATADEILSFLTELCEGNRQATKRGRYSSLSAFFSLLRNSLD